MLARDVKRDAVAAGWRLTSLSKARPLAGVTSTPLPGVAGVAVWTLSGAGTLNARTLTGVGLSGSGTLARARTARTRTPRATPVGDAAVAWLTAYLTEHGGRALYEDITRDGCEVASFKLITLKKARVRVGVTTVRITRGCTAWVLAASARAGLASSTGAAGRPAVALPSFYAIL